MIFSLFLLLFLSLFLTFSVDNTEEKPVAVFVLLRSASIDFPEHRVSDQTEKFFFRGHNHLSQEGSRLAYRQGEEFRRRYVDSELLDKRFLPKEIRLWSSSRDSHRSSALHFGSGLFGATLDGTPIIPTVENIESSLLISVHHDWFEKLLHQAKSSVCQGKSSNRAITPGFTAVLIETAIVESENSHVRLSPELEECLRCEGREAYFKAQVLSASAQNQDNSSTADFIASFIYKVSSRARNRTAATKFEAFLLDGPSLIAFSRVLSALKIWDELPPRPLAAIIIEVKNVEPRIWVHFKREVTSQFEELGNFTLREWRNLEDRMDNKLTADQLSLTSDLSMVHNQSGVVQVDEDLPLVDSLFHEDSLFIMELMAVFMLLVLFSIFIRV